MGTRSLLMVLLVVVAACGTTPAASSRAPASTTRVAAASPSPPPSPSPASRGPLAVMYNLANGTQTVSLVDRDGTVVASATSAALDVEPVPFPGTPTAMLQGGPTGIGGVCCGVTLPEISTTNRRVYFLSGQTDLRYLGVDGSTGLVMPLPNVRGRTQAVFAVSPDDSRIALSVFDWSTKPMKMTISVQDLGGQNRVDIFTSTSVYEWPVAWHSGALVLAVGSVLGGAPNPYAAVSFHVADPKTGRRLATMGSTACPAIGPLMQAGTLCNHGCGNNQGCLDVVDWSGTQQTLYRYVSPQNMGTWAALSPDGGAAVVDDTGQPLGESVVRAGAQPQVIGPAESPFVWWLDGDTVFVYSAPPAATNAYFFRVSTGGKVPLNDQLGQMDGVVPGIS